METAARSGPKAGVTHGRTIGALDLIRARWQKRFTKAGYMPRVLGLVHVYGRRKNQKTGSTD